MMLLYSRIHYFYNKLSLLFYIQAVHMSFYKDEVQITALLTGHLMDY